VPLPCGPTDPSFVISLESAFHETHRRRYGHAAPDEPVELVALRVRATAPSQEVPVVPEGTSSRAPRESAAARFDRDGAVETKVFHRDQRAACVTGEERLRDLVRRHGSSLLARGMAAVMDYAERRMRAAIASLPQGRAAYEDVLDGDGISDRPIRVAAEVETRGETLRVDWSGSSPQVAGPVNAVYAVTASATYYAARVLTDPGSHRTLAATDRSRSSLREGAW
jgi:hypothetical protein